MRSAAIALASLACFFALGCEQLASGLGLGSPASAEAGAPDGAAADAGILGGNCGTESKTGAELCTATSMCPSLVVDTQAMPNCGFRIRGATVDLVCACGTSICPIGVFTSCAEATKLLATQTEQGVCVQLAEERCTESAGATTPMPSSSGGGNPACDRQCMKDCGGGAGCASVCNCN